jgi:hypothetical protein
MTNEGLLRLIFSIAQAQGSPQEGAAVHVGMRERGAGFLETISEAAPCSNEGLRIFQDRKID